MKELDKAAMGNRIRQIRLDAGLRQWELAKLLGTTQSAVHKYEHGVVPEPKRLVELARVGKTTIEWILTGSHWENGSTEQERLSPDLLRTAALLRQVEDRARVDEALRIVRDAVRALGRDSDERDHDDEALRDRSERTLELLESARRIHNAVLDRIARDAGERLRSSALLHGDGEPDGAGGSPTRR